MVVCGSTAVLESIATIVILWVVFVSLRLPYPRYGIVRTWVLVCGRTRDARRASCCSRAYFMCRYLLLASPVGSIATSFWLSQSYAPDYKAGGKVGVALRLLLLSTAATGMWAWGGSTSLYLVRDVEKGGSHSHKANASVNESERSPPLQRSLAVGDVAADDDAIVHGHVVAIDRYHDGMDVGERVACIAKGVLLVVEWVTLLGVLLHSAANFAAWFTEVRRFHPYPRNIENAYGAFLALHSAALTLLLVAYAKRHTGALFPKDVTVRPLDEPAGAARGGSGAAGGTAASSAQRSLALHGRGVVSSDSDAATGASASCSKAVLVPWVCSFLAMLVPNVVLLALGRHVLRRTKNSGATVVVAMMITGVVMLLHLVDMCASAALTWLTLGMLRSRQRRYEASSP